MKVLCDLTADQLKHFRPLHDRILIRRLPEKASSTILLTDKERSLRGEVLATGPGKYCCDHGRIRPVAVVPGQVVYFGEYSDYEEADVLLITEADIRGVEEN